MRILKCSFPLYIHWLYLLVTEMCLTLWHVTKPSCFIMFLLKRTSIPTQKVSSPPERLILAAVMVMKLLNHRPAPRRYCVHVWVYFLFFFFFYCDCHVFEALSIQLQHAHKHTSYWHGNPLPCIFLSSRRGLRPIMRKSIKFLFCWVVLQFECVCLWVCVSHVEQAFMDVRYIKHHHQPLISHSLYAVIDNFVERHTRRKQL